MVSWFQDSAKKSKIFSQLGLQAAVEALHMKAIYLYKEPLTLPKISFWILKSLNLLKVSLEPTLKRS